MMQEIFFNDVAVGWLKKINVRYTYSTFEGDMMRCSARIAEKSSDPSDPWVACELAGTN